MHKESHKAWKQDSSYQAPGHFRSRRPHSDSGTARKQHLPFSRFQSGISRHSGQFLWHSGIPMSLFVVRGLPEAFYVQYDNKPADILCIVILRHESGCIPIPAAGYLTPGEYPLSLMRNSLPAQEEGYGTF